MNKQEYICKLKKHLEAPSELEGTNFDVIYNKAIRRAIHLAEHLDEQEKTTVPQYVADYYESIKDDFEEEIYDICIKFNNDNGELSEEVWRWFDCGKNEPIQTLVKMRLFGYEIEKEKLYTVEIPNPNNIGAERTVLMKNGFNQIVMLRVYDHSDNWRTVKGYQLTESEIKKYFEWAWQWAKEVE